LVDGQEASWHIADKCNSFGDRVLRGTAADLAGIIAKVPSRDNDANQGSCGDGPLPLPRFSTGCQPPLVLFARRDKGYNPATTRIRKK
jgi:hypothetical protein